MAGSLSISRSLIDIVNTIEVEGDIKNIFLAGSILQPVVCRYKVGLSK
ncbi:MAG: hypothetical protein HZB80_06855 [Deltaproteobacteria bacterium]|nr:hypothetical protein [Deltaproteobacteria bacterium]